MIDILTATREGRLAILELKVSEDIELPMQGLDYWLRVRWHHSRSEFQARGYFPGVALSPLPPLLFFVCPQFRYHSTFPALTGQIDPAVPLIQVGINENWREGVACGLAAVVDFACRIDNATLTNPSTDFSEMTRSLLQRLHGCALVSYWQPALCSPSMRANPRRNSNWSAKYGWHSRKSPAAWLPMSL